MLTHTNNNQMKKITAVFISTMMIGYVVKSQNILLKHDSAPIEFSKLKAADVHDAVDMVIKSSDAAIREITAAAGRQTLNNTLDAYDALQYELADLGAKLGLISSTYADDSIVLKY